VTPAYIVARVFAGLIVGILVGLTGVGGGILLVPILTSALGVPPIIAVGSDAAVNCITKLGAGLVHWRRGNVNWDLVLALTLGSIPGAACGVAVLHRLHTVKGQTANNVLMSVIAILLIVIPAASLYLHSSRAAKEELPAARIRYGIVLIGFLAGALVGLTSIGSGAVPLLLLLVFYNYAPRSIVGTDVIHGLVLTAFTSVLQMRLGNVDFKLVAYILAGSIPGGILGAYLTKFFPAERLKRVLFIMLILFGVKILWEGLARA